MGDLVLLEALLVKLSVEVVDASKVEHRVAACCRVLHQWLQSSFTIEKMICLAHPRASMCVRHPPGPRAAHVDVCQISS